MLQACNGFNQNQTDGSNTNTNFIPFRCNVCQNIISSIIDLKEHIKRHKDERRDSCLISQKVGEQNSKNPVVFKCNICEKKFLNSKNLKACFVSYTGEKTYKCEACFQNGKIQSENTGMEISSLSIEKDKNKCDVCGKTFNVKSKLKVHMKIHTGEIEFMCEICGKSYHSVEDLKSHERKHTGEQPYACNLCKAKFTGKRELNSHTVTVHGRSHKCKFCNKMFGTADNKNKHERIHTGELPFSCKLCGLRFRVMESMKRHMNIHYGTTRNYKCDICYKTFSESSYLKAHKTLHSKEGPPISCSYCNRTFIRTKDVKNHILSHTGEKPFKCHLCDAKYVRKHSLNIHIERFHNKNKRFACQLCDKRFYVKERLVIHEMEHTGERPFECTHCAKKFKAKLLLKNHLEIHDGKRHECPQCEKTFSTSIILKGHIRQIHKRGPIPTELKIRRYSCQICDLIAVVLTFGETDKLHRYEYSADTFKIKNQAIKIQQPWRDEESTLSSNGGYKVNVLRENFKDYAENENTIVLYTDSPDTIFLDKPQEIIKRFHNIDARVVFAADSMCWPDTGLKSLYPKVGPKEYRYLNAGAFIGYAKDIADIINHRPINDMESDQLYYSEIFTNKELRKKWGIKLDTKSSIFLNVHSEQNTAKLKIRDQNYIYNSKTTTKPLVIYNSGPVMSYPSEGNFLRLADYLTGAWNSKSECLSGLRNRISLKNLKGDDYPWVVLAIFIDQPTPFITEALDLIGKLDYPKSRIDLFIYVHDEYHDQDVEIFVSDYGLDYRTVMIVDKEENLNHTEARKSAIEVCQVKECDYLFSVDGNVHLSDPQTLKDLIEQNRSVIAPLVSRPNAYWSNFWGAVDINGYYDTADDYTEIVDKIKKGVWNVPYINGVYLINSTILPLLEDAYSLQGDFSTDMMFAKHLRDKGIFMYVTNTKDYGHLINYENYDISHLHNDLWQIFNNQYNWQKRYVHENYTKSLDPEAVIESPCTDVAWFPVVTERFCDEMIEEMENFGEWSSGKNEDVRLASGYENVPTVDIHMKQIGYEDEWLYFLKEYLKPLQKKFFIGYDDEDVVSYMNFVVRYRPDEQPILRPHHDISTWTINIAMNSPNVDFTGGGCRFVRQNCTVKDTKKGWMLMHPGRLTHYHEGLRTLSGTRYILVSFVDP